MSELLNRINQRDIDASKEVRMMAAYEAKVRATTKTFSGTFLPLEIQRRKNGCVSTKQLEAIKYIAIKEGNGEWQASYLVRDNLAEEPRLIYEVKKWDKKRRKYVVNRGDASKLSLKQLPFFTDIQSMFSDVKEISREESLVAFRTNGEKVAEDMEEYQYNDGFAVYEPVEYITYRAKFGKREITYTVNNKTNRIFSVMSYSMYEMAYKGRNKWLSELDNLDAVNARYETAAESKADRELAMGKGVYGEQSLYMF